MTLGGDFTVMMLTSVDESQAPHLCAQLRRFSSLFPDLHVHAHITNAQHKLFEGEDLTEGRLIAQGLDKPGLLNTLVDYLAEQGMSIHKFDCESKRNPKQEEGQPYFLMEGEFQGSKQKIVWNQIYSDMDKLQTELGVKLEMKCMDEQK